MSYSPKARVVRFACLFVILVVSTATGSVRAPRGDNRLVGRQLTHAESTPSSTTGTGDTPVVLQVDDGSAEQTLGVVNNNQTIGTQAVYMNRFTVPDEYLPFTLDSVSFLFPTSTDVGPTGLMAGQTFELLVYLDPDATGVPANATLKIDQTFLLQPSNTIFQVVRLDLPIVIQQGDVWVGFTPTVTSIDNLPIFPGALDTSSISQVRSWVFFNSTSGDHFNGHGSLADADNQLIVQGNWLFRASGQPGGFTCVTWMPPPLALGGTRPPPINAHICDDVPDPVAEGISQGPRDTLIGYNVYRSSSPGVQPTPANRFASVPPSQTQVGSSVASGGSFFVVTGQYDTGESGPSNEIAVTPATITSVKVKTAKLNVRGANFTKPVTVFLDGIPFVTPAKVKKAGTQVVQQGTLLTGETIGAYLAAHGGKALLNIRNTSGTFATFDITSQ